MAEALRRIGLLGAAEDAVAPVRSGRHREGADFDVALEAIQSPDFVRAARALEKAVPADAQFGRFRAGEEIRR